MISIGPQIKISGEKEFRASLREIIAESQRFENQMDRLTSEFNKNDNAIQRNVKMQNLLKQEIENQGRVVEKNNKLHTLAIQSYERTERSLEKQKEHVEKLTVSYNDEKRKVDDLSKAHERHAKDIEECTKLYGEADPNVETMVKRYDEEEKELKEATKALSDHRKELAEAEKKQDDISVSLHRAGEVVNTWELNVQQATNKLDDLIAKLSDYTVIKGWGEELVNASEKMEAFGDAMTKYVTTPLAAVGTYAITAAAQFQDGMAKIYTIAVDSSEPIGKMRDEIIALSNESGFALDDLAEATYQTVSASVDAGDAVEFMAQATKLARAGFTTTTKAVDVLTTIMNSYGKEAYDVEYISDVLLKTQNDGKLVIDELASSLGIIIPMASNYNVGLEQIAAAYATMTKQGVPASKATTFLRAVFTELEKESSNVAKVLEDKTGKSFAQLMDDGNDLSDVLRILYNHVGGNAEEFQRLFGNVRATQAVASLVTDDFKILDTELKRVSKSTGQTDKALEQMETPALKAKRAVNQLKNVGVDLGETMIDMLYPSFENVTKKVAELTQSFIDLAPESKEAIVNGIGLAAAIGPVVTIASKLVGYVGALMAGTAPLAPLIAGVTVAFVGAYTAAKVAAEEERALIEAEWGLSDVSKQNITDLENLRLKHEELQTTLSESWTETLANAGVAENLALKYDSLVDSTGHVKEGCEQLAETLITQIAEALGINASDVQALVDEHGLLHDSIMQTIEDYKNEALASAYKKELEEATYRQVEAERINAEITQELSAQADKLTQANQRMRDAKQAITDAENKGIPVTQDMYEEYRIACDEADSATRAYRDMIDAQSESAAEAVRASEDMDYWADRIANVGKESEDTAKKVKNSSTDAKNAAKDAADSSSQSLKNASNGSGPSGYNFVKGFADSIDTNAYLGGNAASRLGALASKRLNASLQVKSPSRVTAETGKYFVEGFENSIADGLRAVGYLGERLGLSAAKGLAMGSYLPETGNVYNKTVSAPISINLTVNGSVDDPQKFAREVGDILTKQINREVGVFA